MGSFAWLVKIVPMVLRGGRGGPSRGVEIVPMVLRGGRGGPLRGVEIVPMVLRGGGGSLEGCRDSTIGTKGWVGVLRKI